MNSWTDTVFWSVESIRYTSHKDRLDSSSLIVEIGSSHGRDTAKFVELYHPNIISFEPILEIWENLTKKFKSNRKVKFLPFGVGSHTRNESIQNINKNYFLSFSSANLAQMQRIQIINVIDVIENIRQTRTKDGMIDLLSINCDGCEFEVLPALIVNNLTQYFRNIQFGTHLDFSADRKCIYCQIVLSLDLTHERSYHYNLVWEGWVLRN